MMVAHSSTRHSMDSAVCCWIATVASEFSIAFSGVSLAGAEIQAERLCCSCCTGLAWKFWWKIFREV